MRNDITFSSKNTPIGAWHYAPGSAELADKGLSPAVVMAHGITMTKDSGLAPYAERFAANGMHVLVFDYRGFGESGGTPRDLVSINMQLQDYRAAIEAARSLPGVDPGRIALWGTSYSGGIVVEAAARDGRVAAVISQCPNLDNLATLNFLFRRMPLSRFLWLSYSVVADFLAGLFGLPPVYIRAIGRPGERAAYVSEDSWEKVSRIAGPQWNNRMAPRDFLRLPPFRPIRSVARLPCRIQIFACEKDDLTPTGPTFRAARMAGDKCEFHRYPIGHFGIYVDEPFCDALERQTAFLKNELRPRKGV